MSKKVKAILLGVVVLIFWVYAKYPEIIWAMEAIIGCGFALLALVIAIWGRITTKKQRTTN